MIEFKIGQEIVVLKFFVQYDCTTAYCHLDDLSWIVEW